MNVAVIANFARACLLAISMPLGGAPSCGLDKITAFEHLQALVANGPDLEDLDEHDDVS